MNKGSSNSVDQYIRQFPREVQALLKQMRRAIKKAAPRATEKISYGIPGYSLNKILVYFAGYRKHIGFYPGKAAIVKFKKELSKYKGAVGSVQFPLDKPVPLGLVARIVKFRVKMTSGPRRPK